MFFLKMTRLELTRTKWLELSKRLGHFSLIQVEFDRYGLYLIVYYIIINTYFRTMGGANVYCLCNNRYDDWSICLNCWINWRLFRGSPNGGCPTYPFWCRQPRNSYRRNRLFVGRTNWFKLWRHILLWKYWSTRSHQKRVKSDHDHRVNCSPYFRYDKTIQHLNAIRI